MRLRKSDFLWYYFTLLNFQPVYELKGDELVDFPWNHDNIDEWLYRPVKVKGRFVYKHAAIFDKPRLGYLGGHMFVPFITKENENLDYDSRKGIIVNRGWTPSNYKGTKNDSFNPNSHPH